jgi:hypothetical protein
MRGRLGEPALELGMLLDEAVDGLEHQEFFWTFL